MIKLGKYEICLMDLVTGKDNKLSSTQIWYHIANVIESYRILTNDNVDGLEVLFYLTIVGGSKVAMEAIKLKYGVIHGSNINQMDNKE